MHPAPRGFDWGFDVYTAAPCSAVTPSVLPCRPRTSGGGRGAQEGQGPGLVRLPAEPRPPVFRSHSSIAVDHFSGNVRGISIFGPGPVCSAALFWASLMVAWSRRLTSQNARVAPTQIRWRPPCSGMCPCQPSHLSTCRDFLPWYITSSLAKNQVDIPPTVNNMAIMIFCNISLMKISFPLPLLAPRSALYFPASSCRLSSFLLRCMLVALGVSALALVPGL